MSVMKSMLPLAFLALFSLLAGCSIMPWSGDDDEPVSVNWILVEEDPPTYFPEGVDASHPTDAFHGEWIVDHASGSRYFAPREGTGGATKRQLTEDALSRSSGPSAVGEVIDKTKTLSSSAAGKVAAGFDKITPDFGKKEKKEKNEEPPPSTPSDKTEAP